MGPNSSLPILLSIPHASVAVPEEVADRIALTKEELLHFTDLYTDQIFRLQNIRHVQYDYSRVIVDVNRAPDDISKEYELAAEGVIVYHTWDGTSVYKKGCEPDEELVDILIRKYHTPYHTEIEKHIPHVQFLFDCHSYLPVGPKLKNDTGMERPDINIGNVNFSTCSRDQTVFVRDFFQERGHSVAINFPYAGKYILGHHCHRRRIPPFLVPGMQLELNQGLYVDSNAQPLPDQIEKFRDLFANLVESFSAHFFPEESEKAEVI